MSPSLSPDDWDRVWEHAHKESINVSAQENRFKLYLRWYRMPERLRKIFPSVPPMCWRCNVAVCSLLHVWWDCSLIQPFWERVHDLISRITTYTPDFTPAQYLLHHTSLPRKTHGKSLTLHLINAATQCIPLHWKTTTPPTVAEWFKRVNKIEDMERIIHQTRDAHDKFRNTWACWTHYRESLGSADPGTLAVDTTGDAYLTLDVHPLNFRPRLYIPVPPPLPLS